MENLNRTNMALPADVSEEILQKMQDESAIMRLAYETKITGRGKAIPVVLGDPEAEWVGETEKKPVSNSEAATKMLRPYKLAVIQTFSKEFKRDLPALYDALIARMPKALGQKFDNTVIGGTTKPGSDFDNFATATGQAITANTAYDALVNADTDIAAHGGIVTGYALAPQARGVLLKATDANKRPLFINNMAEGAIPMILGAKTVQSKGIYAAGAPNKIGIVGDWSMATYGTVEGVSISISEEATLDIGERTINLWQQNMIAVMAEIEIGFRAVEDCFNILTLA